MDTEGTGTGQAAQEPPGLRGHLAELFPLNGEPLAPLLAEAQAHLWNTLRWRSGPPEGPVAGLAWVDGDQVLGFLPLAVNDSTVVVGRMFATRNGPAEAVEAALIDAAIRVAYALPQVQRLCGELLSATPATLDRLWTGWPGQVRLRSLMQAGWTGPQAAAGPALTPWLADDLPATAALLLRAHAADPKFLPDPSFCNQEGITRLVERVTTHEDCGVFQPRASFVARATETGAMLGFILATRMGPDQGHVAEVAVAPEAQRRGVGRALLVRAMDALAELGCRRFNLAVDLDNAGAIAFYRRHGFVDYHRFPDLRLERGGTGAAMLIG